MTETVLKENLLLTNQRASFDVFYVPKQRRTSVETG
jgi:hypothetical protein